MNLSGRSAITHLLSLAAGLVLGIYLTKNNVPADIHESSAPEIKTVGGTAPGAMPATGPGAEANAVPAATSSDPALLKLREDYDEQIRKGEQRQALLILQEMEKSAPKSQIYLETNSEYQTYTRDWQTAASVSKACVAAFPQSRLCYRNWATAELSEGSTEEQATAVDGCLKLEPNDPMCRNMLGMVQMNGGDYPSAIATYERLIRENGSFGTRFTEDHLEWQLGLALEGAGRREEAIDHLENACRRNMNQACQKIEELSAEGLE